MRRELHVRALSTWRGGQTGAPAAELLPRRARGRASLLTSMLAEVVSRVASEGQVELSAAPLIVGSAYGEMVTTTQLLEMMAKDDGALSPARFQASVHNTAAGLISIATGSQGFSSCLAAGKATCAAVLVEAFAWLGSRGGDLIVAVGDESLPEPFAAGAPHEPIAMAMLLSSQPGRRTLATLGPPLHDEAAVAVPTHHADSQALRINPSAQWLDLFAAITAGRRAMIALPGVTGSWRFEVTPVGAVA